MRINAKSTLTLDDVREAINLARHSGQDIYLQEGWTGPKGAVRFWCNSAHGKYSTGRSENTGRAATWTAWGYVIAELYVRDPNARISTYRNRVDFINQIHAAQETYYNRRAFGIPERANEPGADISFLEVLG